MDTPPQPLRVARIEPIALTPYLTPFFLSPAPAGVPLPTDDHGDLRDLNEILGLDGGRAFVATVTGSSMIDARIDDGDHLVVERTDTASNRDIVIAAVDGQLTVKRLLISDGMIVLSPENAACVPIAVSAVSELRIWGVVRWVVHRP